MESFHIGRKGGTWFFFTFLWFSRAESGEGDGLVYIFLFFLYIFLFKKYHLVFYLRRLVHHQICKFYMILNLSGLNFLLME